MMKTMLCLFCAVFLCACAGNPPAWWNPSGSYASEPRSAAPVRPTLPSAVTPEEEEPVPAEQNIEPAMESYEEINLTPLAEDTEPEAEELLNAREESVPLADRAQTAGTNLPAAKQPVALPAPAPQAPAVPQAAVENLPGDGSLPAPSVLE